MNNFLLKLSSYLVAVLLSLSAIKSFLLTPATQAFEGEPTADRIKRAFHSVNSGDFDCLIMGNSRVYRGINPAYISSCKAFNFAHDADTFNQTYYKLKYVLARKRPKAVVISLDYFDFGFIAGRRNSTYKLFLPPEYFADYQASVSLESIYELLKGLNNSWNIFAYNELLTPTKYLLLRMHYSLRGRSIPPPSFQRDNGQYVKLPLRQGDPLDWANREKEAQILPIQESYFVRLVELAQANNIELVFVTSPCRAEELSSYAPATLERLRETFKRWAEQHEFVYLDYSMSSEFTRHDFSDITHLNHVAADRFTKMLDKDLRRIFHDTSP
jgi:hypothetical protein